MNTDVDHLFLSRAAMRDLMDQLRKIPRITADLATTISRQATIASPGLGTVHRAPPASQPPIHLGAFQASEDLYWHLSTTVRIVCEERALACPAVGYQPPRFVGPPRPRPDHIATMVELGQWLNRYVVSLGMTEGALEMRDDICDAIRACEEVIDLPPENYVPIDGTRLRRANNSVLTAYQVEKIAGKLGELGKGLNRDRVRYLVKNGLRVADRDGETAFYRLGDVLDAHMRHRRNGKKGESAA